MAAEISELSKSLGVSEIPYTLQEAFTATEYKAKYDAAAKELLLEKVLLALIMKYCVEEYKDCGLDEIIGLIEGEPEIDIVPVQRDLPKRDIAPRITGADTVDKTQNEGTYYFDIKFDAALPKNTVKKIKEQSKDGRRKSVRQAVGVIINIEPHGRHAPGYPLNTRMEYYLARLLSGEYGKVFTGEEFGKLKKVYSIWIVMDAPAYCANTVMVYETQERSLIGVGENEAVKEFHTDPSTFQLMTGVVIRLGDAKSVAESKNDLLRVLGTVLSDKVHNKERMDVLSDVLKRHNIPMTNGMERRFGKMGTLADLFEERVIRETRQKYTVEAIQNLMETTKWSVEKAMECLKVPLEQRDNYAALVSK